MINLYTGYIFKYCYAIDVDKTEVIRLLKPIFVKKRPKEEEKDKFDVSVGQQKFIITTKRCRYKFELFDNAYALFIAYKNFYYYHPNCERYIELMDIWLEKIVLAINGEPGLQMLPEPESIQSQQVKTQEASEKRRKTMEAKRKERTARDERIAREAGVQYRLKFKD